MITPFALMPGVVVRCRPLGLLKMADEEGDDAKVLAVPDDKVLPIYSHWRKHDDINAHRLSPDSALLRTLQRSRAREVGHRSKAGATSPGAKCRG